MFQENHIPEMSSLQKLLNLLFNPHQRKRIPLSIQMEWTPGFTGQQLIISIDFHNGTILWVSHHPNFQNLTIQDTDLTTASLNLNHWFSTTDTDFGWCNSRLSQKKFIFLSQKYINKEQILTDQILEQHFTVRLLNNWLNQKKFIFLSQKFINKEQTPINQISEPLFMVRHLKNWLNQKKSVSLSQKFIKIEQTLINQTSELHSTLQLIMKILNSEFERNEISS